MSRVGEVLGRLICRFKKGNSFQIRAESSERGVAVDVLVWVFFFFFLRGVGQMLPRLPR